MEHQLQAAGCVRAEAGAGPAEDEQRLASFDPLLRALLDLCISFFVLFSSPA